MSHCHRYRYHQPGPTVVGYHYYYHHCAKFCHHQEEAPCHHPEVDVEEPEHEGDGVVDHQQDVAMPGDEDDDGACDSFVCFTVCSVD